MNQEDTMADLTQKVINGTATSEEQLQLAQNLNHSVELLLKFIEEVKLSHGTQQS